MVIAYLPLIIAAVGLALYLVATQPKPAEVGRILFFAGVLAFALGSSIGHLATTAHVVP